MLIKNTPSVKKTDPTIPRISNEQKENRSLVIGILLVFLPIMGGFLCNFPLWLGDPMDSTLETVGSINMILSLLAALGIVMTAYGGIKISVRRRRMLTYLGMVLLGGLVFIFAISWFRYMKSFASLLIKYEIWR